MRFNFPVDIARPTRVYDQGATSETMPATGFWSLWCRPEINGAIVQIDCHGDEDVRIGDLIRLPYNLQNRR